MDKTTAALAKTLALALGGGIGYLMWQMSRDGSLAQYLNYKLFGNITRLAGAALVVMVALRAYAMAFRPAAACCGHDHGDDGHDHSHGVSLWRMMVLVVPVTLLAMGWAPRSLSAAAMRARKSAYQKLAIDVVLPGLSPERQAAAKNSTLMEAKTSDLFEAAKQADTRAYWESTQRPKAVDLTGQFFPSAGNASRYQLMQPKMTCCAQDATPVMVVVLAIPPKDWREGDWVRVQGIVSFKEDQKSASFIPVVHGSDQKKLDGPPPAIYN